MAELESEKNDRKFSIFLTILLALILALSVVLFAFSNNESNSLPTYTTTFSNVTPAEAYVLINNTTPGELRVIDCRGLEVFCPCQFDSTKISSRAEFWDGAYPTENLYQNISDPKNITDILVYSINGVKGATLCEELIGHVCGKIYNLKDGQKAWAAANYPVGANALP
jgi:hypothetical protein